MTKRGQLISTYFGENVFSLDKILSNISPEVGEKLKKLINHGQILDRETSDAVAKAMKEWAVSKGCTHYTHWFQPMTGFTAEKHDSFLEYGDDGNIIESFSGKQLIQGEPDASSFPSGGIRATFEARGYTIWDPTSPAFVLEYPHGNTLCIPSIFISYTGEALDKKAPLLRSIQVLNNAGVEILKLFKNPGTKVYSTLGIEQEYFLIDRELYNRRPDLFQTGRTLFGNAPSKHQQLEDQYFGNIPERAFAFMTEIEEEAYKLGIPLKTRHNEVAPNQFEAAPIFEDVNVAVDHNQVLMDLMDRVATRQKLACLLHEKPFAGVNGSGKHCNWSISTDAGENLLNPGKTPHQNLQFLVFLVSTIKAVYDYSSELRASIASCANDNRLGANEAPPAIISVFVGELLHSVLNDLAEGKTTKTTEQAWLSVGIDKIPSIPKDNTDRNRTSPFAFTGNKFEFRAVGSSASPSGPITVLNTAVSAILVETKNKISKEISKGKDFNTATVKVLREMIKESRKILFEGDNYSSAWEKEAEKRGLPNLKTTPDALKIYSSKKTIELFSKFGIFSPRELESRHHIYIENYIKQVEIEARVSRDMAVTYYLPVAINYLKKLSDTVEGFADATNSKSGVKSLIDLLKVIANKISGLQKSVADLDKLLSNTEKVSSLEKKSFEYLKVKKGVSALRSVIDELEQICPDASWPVPKYREMLLTL